MINLQNSMIITIDANVITDFDSLHDAFKKALGFPEFYGHNMNAWIDCMRDIHQDTGMSKVFLPKDGFLILRINSTRTIDRNNPKILEELSACTAFVNEYLNSRGEGLIYLLLI